MKKIYLTMIAVAAMTFAACGGSANKSSESAEAAEAAEEQTEQVAAGEEPADQSLVGTTWKQVEEIEDDDEQSKVEAVMTFEKGGICKFDITFFGKDGKPLDFSRKFAGPYTFDGESGELKLKAVDGASTPDDGKFTLNDGTLWVNYYNNSYKLTKQ